MAENKEKNVKEKNKKVGIGAYLALILGILFFSGVFKDVGGPLSALDFTNVLGSFGGMGTVEDGAVTLANNFRGTGGGGVRDGFLFALTIMPAVIFSLGIVQVMEDNGGLVAAQKLLNPILKPILGVPGSTGIAIVASLQSADAGAALINDLASSDQVDEKQRLILGSFQYSAGGLITNFLSSGAALFAFITTPIIVPLAICFVFKFVAANLARVYFGRVKNDSNKKNSVKTVSEVS